jgi:hypothetical protein
LRSIRFAEVRPQVVAAHLGEQRGPVLVSLASADHDQPLIEVEILDPKLATLRHSQAAAVDERRHQIVAGSQSCPQRLKCFQRARAALLVHHRAGRALMPFRSLQEVDKVDAEGLICLAHLPIFAPAVPFKFFAEPPYLVRDRLVGRRARQKPSDPSHEVRSGSGLCQLGLERKLAELLE